MSAKYDKEYTTTIFVLGSRPKTYSLALGIQLIEEST